MPLSVTNARLSDLRTLGANPDSRIVGKKDKEGNIVIYESKNLKPGLWSRISGDAARKRDLAHQGVERIMRNTYPLKSVVDTTLLSCNQALNANQREEVRGAALRLLAQAAEMPGETGPRLDACGPWQEAVAKVGAAYAEIRGDPAAVKELAEFLGDRLAAGFLKGDPDHAAREGFALSDGQAMKAELGLALREQPGTHGDFADLLDRDARKFLDTVFNRAAATTLPNQIVDGDTLRYEGRLYTKGTVFKDDQASGLLIAVYKPVDESDKRPAIILKQFVDPKSSDAESKKIFAEGVHEAEVFRKASAGGNNNVLAMHGLVRSADGMPGIIMEYADKGIAQQAMWKIADALKAGDITPKAASAIRLTLIHDMVKGMQQVSGQNRVHHLDFKSDNVFIDDDGVGKVADFGRSLQADGFSFADVEGNQTSWMYVAPEMIQLEDQRWQAQQNVKARNDPAAELRAAFPGIADDDVKVLTRSLARERQADARKGFDLDAGKADAWALGSTIFEMAYGRPISSLRGDAATKALLQDNIGNSGLKVVDRAIEDRGLVDVSKNPDMIQPTSFAGSTGNADLDDLINALMDLDSGNRLAIDGAAGHRVFQGAGLGGQDARDMIKAVLSGDRTKMADLNARFS